MDDSAGSQNWLPDRMEWRDKETRHRMWAGIFAAFLAGIFIGGMVVLVILNRGVDQITGNADKAITALKTKSAAWERSARECNAQFSTATLLVENPGRVRANVRSISPFAAALESLAPGGVTVRGGDAMDARNVEGWYVPAKVEPIAYGKGQRFYWYFDRNEKKISGPFVPVRSGALVQ